MMSDGKNQHSVPRLYLKRFTRNGSQIYVFDKFHQFRKTSKPKSIKSVASDDYFYNIPEEHFKKLDPFLIDNVFTKLENKYATSLAEMIESVTRGRRIIKHQKEALAIHIALQILRTLEFRNSYIELSKKVRKDLSEAYLRSKKLDAEVEVSIENDLVPAAHAKMMFSPELLEEFVPFLIDCIWMVGVNETTQPLYTSDNPVVKNAHLADIVPYGNGWLSPGVEIVFPLSSKLVLFLQGKELYRATKSQVIQNIGENLDGNLVPLQADHVLHYNSLQVLHSYRQIYCESDNFSLARKVCDEHPDICDPDRPRWASNG